MDSDLRSNLPLFVYIPPWSGFSDIPTLTVARILSLYSLIEVFGPNLDLNISLPISRPSLCGVLTPLDLS